MNLNDQSVSGRFGEIISGMKTLSKYSVTMHQLTKKEVFDPNVHFVSIIPFLTLSMICYIESLVHNLGEHPLLRGGTYVGSKSAGARNDITELQIPVTDDNGRRKK